MDQRAVLKNLMEEKGLNLGTVSRALGCSASALSQWLSNSYKGNVSKITEAVKGFLERQEERSKTPKQQVAFVQTVVAKRFFETARICHLDGEIGVAYGDAGIGKTAAAKEYTARNTDVILIEADLGYTARVLFTELSRRLGLEATGTIHDMFEEVKGKLTGSGRLIIVDEAEHLPYRALELLRRVYDKAGIGILLVGMPRLVNNLRGKRGEYAQLYSRVGIAVNLQRLIGEDTSAIVHSLIPNSNGLWKEFHEGCGGNTRVLVKLLLRSIRIADVNQVPVTAEVVKVARQQLIF